MGKREQHRFRRNWTLIPVMIIRQLIILNRSQISNLNMHNFQFNPQFNSNATSEPTVPVTAYYEPRADVKSLKKEPLNIYPQSEQHQYRIRNQFDREIEICHSEIQTLKEQIQLLQKEKDTLQDTIQLLKKQRIMGDNENRRLFQQNQKNRQLVQKLKIDNRSMEMQIQKFRSERKSYNNNLGNIQILKRDIAAQLAQKNSMLQQISSKLRKVERNNSEYRLKNQDLQRTCNESQLQKRQLREELKITLQKYLQNQNILNKMDYQLKEVNQLNKNLKDKIFQMEKEREQMILKLGYDLSDSRGNQQSQRSNYHPNHRSMVQVQSYMKQIENVLDQKKQDMDKKRKNYDKLKISIECLQKLL